MDQKGTTRTRAVNDRDTATIPPKAKGRVDKAAATQLLSAVWDGDIATVRRLVTKGHVDVNVTNEDGQSPLFASSFNGHLVVVKTLIEAGAKTNHADKNGWSPLGAASQNGHFEIVKRLIEAGANVNHTSKKHNTTPLYVASLKGHLDIVQSLLREGANVNLATSNARSPLWIASAYGHFKVVNALLARGANINQANKIHETPLFMACENGHHDVVNMLLGVGADVKMARSNDGWNPLHAVSFKGHLDVVKMLIEAEANVNSDTKNGWSPSYVASFKGHLDILKTLIEAGANIHLTDKQGKSALDIAVEKGLNEIIEVIKFYQSKVIALKTQRLRTAEERAKYAEQQLLQMKVQNDTLQQQIILQSQQADDRIKTAEVKAIRAEQELLEPKKQNEALQNQIRQQAQRTNDRVRRAEARAMRAEQELRLSRQQAEVQLKYKVTHVTPQNSDNTKSLWRVEHDEIEVMEGNPLGVGGWGEVRVAMFRGIKVAAKFMHEDIISPHNIGLFIREMNMAASVRHPNLLLFIGATLDNNKPVILTELMPANLRSIISVLVREQVVSIGTDVAQGLNYLHLMRPDPIIHRDVSSANILVEPNESGGYIAKVSDYGSVNVLSKVTTMGPGNASYAAPESMNPRLQSPKMDVYSYGILLLEMATGQFPDCTIQGIQLDTLLWEEMNGMIRKCITEDPANRPTMKDILNVLPQFNK